MAKDDDVWRNIGRESEGVLTAGSGSFEESHQINRSRLESQPFTNHGDLIAAIHSGCSALAAAFQPRWAGCKLSEFSIKAAVTIETTIGGGRTTRSALALKVEVLGPVDSAMATLLAGCTDRREFAECACCAGAMELPLDLMVGQAKTIEIVAEQGRHLFDQPQTPIQKLETDTEDEEDYPALESASRSRRTIK